MGAKQWFGEADTAGISVEQVQIGLEEFFCAGSRGIFHTDGSEIFHRRSRRWGTLADGGAEIPAVAHEQERGDSFEGMEEPEHARLTFTDGVRERLEQRALESDPVGGGVHFVFGEFERTGADVFVGEEFDFLEPDDLGADENVAVGTGCRFIRAFTGGDFQDADLRVADGIGVVIDIDLLHVRFALFEVEMFDVVLLAAVNIDGFFMDSSERADEIDFADNERFARDVDDDEIIAGDGTKADGVCGVGFMGPVIVFSCEMQIAGLCQASAEVSQIHGAEFLFRVNGKFERGAFQVID